ncbi:polyphenol oxidase [Marchantia polymorpha subsp. ruderalis]|nr:hypothetical protein MARPO_0248s0003 [Marchantia polymorpha]BBN13262.1 hypothetical protein Mp_6g02130 [Marchantia polymorpha subsp. ruderalis]|eukprot:PTQ26986.1 hypothetical protein MARPO_0248s0003 [Marchantia polymorpha]
MAIRSPMVLVGLFLLCCMLSNVQSAPIKITRETIKECRRGQWAGIPADCCPPKIIDGPIIDFTPPKLDPSKPLRVRKALQCLSGKELRTYTKKLQKGYRLMRALPDTDPRSYARQYGIHCAYATGSFIQDGSNNLTIDIHIGWYFHPWHRAYVYFHEKILQTLLNDTEFSLHYWNYDNTNSLGKHEARKHRHDGGCYKSGLYFPPMYNDPTKATFQWNRSERAFEPKRPVDLAFDGTHYNITLGPPPFPNNLTLAQIIWRNNELMHRTFLTWGNSTIAFMGKEYREGDPQALGIANGAGMQEKYSHTSMHCYIGGKMFEPKSAPEDPIFFPFHANLERLWDIWLSLGDDHRNPTSSDWLDGEFLLWDENAVMNRFRVRDFLSAEALGYTYQKANVDSWVNFDTSSPYPEY